MNDELKTLIDHTEQLDTQAFVRHVHDHFGTCMALASSLSAEDQVLTHMLAQIDPKARVFTIDTGRLPQPTYDLIDETRKKYGIGIRVVFPDRRQVEAMVNEHGVNLFGDSVDARKLCCHVRKVLPLQRELSLLRAWMTGLRREQAVTRSAIDRVQWDDANELVKLNPLADWSEQDVWDYIGRYEISVNALHAQDYRSIGCACCTRPVAPGDDVRSGRWWWEQPEHKECGLHLVNGQLVRKGE